MSKICLFIAITGYVFASGCDADDSDAFWEAQEVSAAATSSGKPMWALPTDEDAVLGDPMKIVETQRSRIHEYAELTRRALSERPPECDTEMREEVEDEVVPLTIYLPEQPFDFRRYRGLRDASSRRSLTEERKNQLRPYQDAVAEQIERLGGVVTNYEYILNAVDADVPVCLLNEAAAMTGVLGIEIEGPPPVPASVDGIERRAAFGLPSAGHSIFNGAFGSTQSSANRVHYAVIEGDDYLNSSHLSFKAGPTGTRILDTDRCAFWFPSYRCINSAEGTMNSHGTRVTSVLLSDYALGQSPLVVSPIERNRRSGVAPRATVHYYSTKGGWRTVRTAVREASLEDHVDIINLSLVSLDESTWCLTPTLSGVRAAFAAAVDAGVVAVVSAGNNGRDPANCTVSPVATYPSTISVGGTEDAVSLSALESVSRDPGSSHGVRSVVIAGGRSVTTPLVDLVANFCHRMMAGDGAGGTTSDCGTSFSAPAIAGVAGLIKHWIAHRGGLPQGMANDPIAIRAILSLMADGRSSWLDQLGHRDIELGYGNVRFVDLDTDTGQDGSWGIHRVSVSTGTVHEWNIGATGLESLNLQGFKAVAIADRNVYDESPDISFQLIDKCSSSGTSAVLSATRSALQWRLRAWESITPYLLHNRCLWLRATTSSAVSATNLYVAWTLYSNDRIHHDASNQ